MINKINNLNKIALLIGGGDLLEGRQDEILRETLKLQKNKTIVLGYLPIAMLNNMTMLKDLSDYVSQLKSKFKRLDSRVTVKSIIPTHIRGNITDDQTLDISNVFNQIKDLIKESDIIFLSGGDTNYLIKSLVDNGLDRALREEYNSGKIIIGNSAGVLAMFSSGYSFWKGISKRYEGIGLIKRYIPIVHYQEPVPKEFETVSNSIDLEKVVRLQDNSGCLIINNKLVN